MQGAEQNVGGASGVWAKVRPWVLMFLGIAVAFWLIGTFVMRPYRVPTGSMEDTIMPGDDLFSQRVSYYFTSPQPGDIVTFTDPADPGRFLVKRVIATGGQTVSFVNGSVLVDGVVNAEPYVKGKSYPSAYGMEGTSIHYPYTVPEGELWVMGDNRENSQDSRFFGPVPVSSVTGKALFVYWPLDRIRLFA